jgi:hypothetical protein
LQQFEEPQHDCHQSVSSEINKKEMLMKNQLKYNETQSTKVINEGGNYVKRNGGSGKDG